MARLGITYQDIANAAEEISAQGVLRISPKNVTGSKNIINLPSVSY